MLQFVISFLCKKKEKKPKKKKELIFSDLKKLLKGNSKNHILECCNMKVMKT